MKELLRTNFWEDRITSAIKRGSNNDDFPKPDDYGFTNEEFDDYVIEKQYLLDKLYDRRNNFLVPGLLLILPIIIISIFNNSVKGLFAGMVTGIIFASAYIFTLNAIDKKKLNKLNDERMEKYINDILCYSK